MFDANSPVERERRAESGVDTTDIDLRTSYATFRVEWGAHERRILKPKWILILCPISEDGGRRRPIAKEGGNDRPWRISTQPVLRVPQREIVVVKTNTAA